MTDAELLQIIKKAARKGATKLDLSSKELYLLRLDIGEETKLNESTD